MSNLVVGKKNFGMGRVNSEVDAALKRSRVVQWLNTLFPDFNMPMDATEEELRAQLIDGTVLCAILNGNNPCSIQSQRRMFISLEQRLDNLERFLSAMDEMGLPSFNVSELERGSLSAVVECLLCFRDQLSIGFREDGIYDVTKSGCQPRKKWNLVEGDRVEPMDASQGNPSLSGSNSLALDEERRTSLSESKFQRAVQSPVTPEASSTLLNQMGNKLHEVFKLKQGLFADVPAAKISEMMKSNTLDNAPTQSLLSVVNGILDESFERKNTEIPHRVACLLRKLVQEIERRISTQAEYIRSQNNVIKAREEKYQSRIRVLEALVSGTTEENQIVTKQLQMIKTEKTKIEETKKHDDQDMIRLMKEKDDSEHIISELKQELEMTHKRYENRCQQLENNAKKMKVQMEDKIKEVEILLTESRKRTKELEAFSESKFQNWNKKEHVFQNVIGFQLDSVKNLRLASESIKDELFKSQKGWKEEMCGLGLKLKVLVDAAENYHTVLAENRRLYNEVQELKGNIRVYCRIRPFLPGQNGKSTTIDYIGENGEILLVNPSKQGKDGRRLYKFNKIFGATATQEQVYLDIQPLVRSVLDGYNVCIFAYGQTGSGKTYTMVGRNSPSKEDWGVNYRALSDLFQISQTRSSTFLYEVCVQMVEIYNEQVRDLLTSDASKRRLGILNTSQPSGLAVPDAIMLPVKSTSDVLELMQFGLTNRATSSTALNERSSRSHSVVTIHVKGVDLKTGSTSRGCLHLVDLAGSERVERSEATGDRLKEAKHINKSLSALGDVIFALAQKSTHVPYRNSKLTQLLQTSLGGQAKTLMFVQVNPDVESYSETTSTLKFAERVSGVELGAAKSSKEGKDVRDLMERVASLKDTIMRKDEEIEQLQLLNDLRTQAPNGNDSLRHSSSLPGGMTQRGQRLLGGKVATSTASDPENGSEFSDKYSEAGSLQSVDDFKHQKESLYQQKFNGREMGIPVVELAGFGDADSDERLSDISDGGLSAEAENDSSERADITLLPEDGRPSDVIRDKIPKAPARMHKPLSQKTPTSVRPKSRDSLKSSVPPRESRASLTIMSSVKPLKR